MLNFIPNIHESLNEEWLNKPISLQYFEVTFGSVFELHSLELVVIFE
jgi:hypothetical protein